MESAARAGGLGVSLRVTVIACARGHALPTCPPARQHYPPHQRHKHNWHFIRSAAELYRIQLPFIFWHSDVCF